MDAFHALGKCSHLNCGPENQEFTSLVEKSEDLKGKFERCSKCRTKPYEELNTEEKKVLIECIKENDCDNSNEFYQKYKDKEEFKQLIKCLESKCADEYKAIQKYVAKPTTDSPAVTQTDAQA